MPDGSENDREGGSSDNAVEWCQAQGFEGSCLFVNNFIPYIIVTIFLALLLVKWRNKERYNISLLLVWLVVSAGVDCKAIGFSGRDPIPNLNDTKFCIGSTSFTDPLGEIMTE